ncbi:MAG: WD40 repeat domain-containing protein, partial [Actinomycetota bacterium]
VAPGCRGPRRRRWRCRAGPVFIKDIVVLPDGRVVSSAIDGFENLIHIWDPTDLDAPVVTRSVPNGANTLLVLADGRVAEGRDDGAIAIWNPVAPATPDAEFSGHGAAVRDMIELPDGRIVSAGDGPTVRIWDPTCAEADTSPIEGLRCLRVS